MKKNVQGLTLVELLVVMAIMFIIGTGLFSLITDITRAKTERSSLLKNQAHINFVMDNLIKIVSTAGFGLSDTSLTYGTAIDLLDSNRRLVIQTRASTENIYAGCWGIVDENGVFTLQLSSSDVAPKSINLYRNCPTNLGDYTTISVIDKKANCTRQCVAFYNVPNNQLELSTTTTNLPSECMTGTSKLMLRMNNNTNSIISCVADLRFRYIYTSGGKTLVSDTRPNYDDLKGVRICMIVQLIETGRATKEFQEVEPQYSERCGSSKLSNLNTTIGNNWRLRKWAVVERDIFMPNLERIRD